MSGPLALDSLDLAALLCSRVCHDLISLTGAIVNGIEVLEQDNDSEMRTFALDLIKKSARTASARLQFCRVAFGAAGSAAAKIALGDAETMARGFMEDEKTRLCWNVPRALLSKNRVNLLLNMLLVAVQTCTGSPNWCSSAFGTSTCSHCDAPSGKVATTISSAGSWSRAVATARTGSRWVKVRAPAPMVDRSMRL